MLVGTLLGWIIIGLVVGAIARVMVPGRQDFGIGFTIVLGIIGAFVGGFLSSLFFGPGLLTDPSGVYVVSLVWPGWIMAVVGATLVLAIIMVISGSAHHAP